MPKNNTNINLSMIDRAQSYRAVNLLTISWPLAELSIACKNYISEK